MWLRKQLAYTDALTSHPSDGVWLCVSSGRAKADVALLGVGQKLNSTVLFS